MLFLESVCVLMGSFFCLSAAVGTYRFPDFYTRLHAAGQISCFGIGFFLLALILKFPEAPVFIKSLLCLVFIFLSVPVATHVLIRVAHARKVHTTPSMKIDQFSTHETPLKPS